MAAGRNKGLRWLEACHKGCGCGALRRMGVPGTVGLGVEGFMGVWGGPQVSPSQVDSVSVRGERMEAKKC